MNRTHKKRPGRISPLLFAPLLLPACYGGPDSDFAEDTEAADTDGAPPDDDGGGDDPDSDSPPAAPTGGVPTEVDCEGSGAPDTIDGLYKTQFCDHFPDRMASL